jgi:hypothetical protein
MLYRLTMYQQARPRRVTVVQARLVAPPGAE